jgi:hypothetical protein
MDLGEQNEVEIKVGDYFIQCRGEIQSDSDSEPVGVGEDGAVISHATGVTIKSLGGKCTYTPTDEERVFPAGLYRIDATQGLQKIGDIAVDE